MGEDASLEDFLDAGDDEPSHGASGASSDEATDDAATDSVTDEAVDDRRDEAADDRPGEVADDRPDEADGGATTTFAWSAAADPCEACGAAVERRWRDGSRLVCDACKDW